MKLSSTYPSTLRGWVSSALASYSRGPGFKFRPRCWLSRLFRCVSWLFAVSPSNWRNIAFNFAVIVSLHIFSNSYFSISLSFDALIVGQWKCNAVKQVLLNLDTVISYEGYWFLSLPGRITCGKRGPGTCWVLSWVITKFTRTWWWRLPK